jgi:outer membrane protein
MKKVSLILLLALGATLGAQAQKIGYVDFEYVIAQSPDAKSMDSELQTYSAQLEARLKQKEAEVKQKQAALENVLPALRPQAEEDLNYAYSSYQREQQNLQQLLVQKQNELMQPIIKKIQTTIDEVAKEKNFDYVLLKSIQGTPFMLYAKDESNDLTNAVLAKLGVTPVEALPPGLTE